MNNSTKCLSYITLGYRDYTASRFLLNNGYYFQGLTLASSAVEKYLKAILAFNGRTKKVHLTDLESLRKTLSESYIDVTEHFDSRFMTLLGKAYKARYYDDLQAPIGIGFFVNQFLGELDYIIDFFENKVILELIDSTGNVHKTQYKRDIENKNPDLYKNNYILNDISKKEHMEKPDTGVGLYFDPNQMSGEIQVLGKGIINEYNGTIWEINIKQEGSIITPQKNQNKSR